MRWRWGVARTKKGHRGATHERNGRMVALSRTDAATMTGPSPDKLLTTTPKLTMSTTTMTRLTSWWISRLCRRGGGAPLLPSRLAWTRWCPKLHFLPRSAPFFVDTRMWRSSHSTAEGQTFRGARRQNGQWQSRPSCGHLLSFRRQDPHHPAFSRNRPRKRVALSAASRERTKRYPVPTHPALIQR